MTDANDSFLFGNNEELYSPRRHVDEYEPFAQALPPSAEPLFPAAPHSVDAAYDGTAHDEIAHYGVAHEENAPVDGAASGSEPVNIYGVWTDVAADSATYPQPTPFPGQVDSPEQVDEDVAVWQAASASPTAPTSSAPTSSAPTSSAPTSSAPTSSEPLYGFAPHQEEHLVAGHKPAMSEKDLLFNRHLAVLMDLMQHGAWPQALEKVQAMRVEFPHVEALEALHEEASLKAELMAQWTHKIKGRRLTVGQEWLIRRSLPFLMLFALFVSGLFFYRTYVAPSRQVLAMERANQALVEEATALLQVGQVDEAIWLYNEVLERNPEYAPARQGLNDASHLSGLAATYDVAIRVANSGNLKRSLLLLQSIKAKSPTFRDIDARLTRVNSLLEAEAAYNLAERAFAERRWVDAIRYYEQTQLLAADYQALRVGLQLSVAYSRATQRLMNQWPAADFGTEQTRDFLHRSQAANGQDENVRTFLANLDQFIKGERSLNNNNLADAVDTWSKLYAEQPAFMGGYLAEQLYRAYLVLAAEVRDDDPERARELYTLAAAMPVHDSGEARFQLQSLGSAVPAAQPMQTSQPPVAFVMPVVAMTAI